MDLELAAPRQIPWGQDGHLARDDPHRFGPRRTKERRPAVCRATPDLGRKVDRAVCEEFEPIVLPGLDANVSRAREVHIGAGLGIDDPEIWVSPSLR
jgi:hypothetical protein